jgi:DNA-binding transcriptional LysR family regulator
MSESLLDLRLFVAAYEEGSFTAAATRENATQSGVSQHIQKLEAGLGVALFKRCGGRMMPTAAGEDYYRRSVEILETFQAAEIELGEFRKGLTGEITIGLIPTLTTCALTPALATFVDNHPNARVRVVEGYDAALTNRVRSGEFAFAIVPAFHRSEELDSRHLQSTPEVLVSRRSFGLKRLAPVRLADLPRLKMIVPGPGNIRRQTIERYVAANGIQLQSMIELDTMMGTLDLVATSDWVTILPGIMMASEIDRSQFNIHPIVNPELMLELVLIRPANQQMHPIAKVFLRLLETETAKVNLRWQELAGPGPGSDALPSPEYVPALT